MGDLSVPFLYLSRCLVTKSVTHETFQCFWLQGILKISPRYSKEILCVVFKITHKKAKTTESLLSIPRVFLISSTFTENCLLQGDSFQFKTRSLLIFNRYQMRVFYLLLEFKLLYRLEYLWKETEKFDNSLIETIMLFDVYVL